MSVQEILTAINELPPQQRQQLIEQLRLQETPAVPTDPQELAAYRQRLAEKIHWQGGDGLEYQLKMRAEWDNRPSLDR